MEPTFVDFFQVLSGYQVEMFALLLYYLVFLMVTDPQGSILEARIGEGGWGFNNARVLVTHPLRGRPI